MAGNIYGLDLGTYEIRIYDKKRDRIRREKNTVALKDRKYIFAAGDEAYEIYEKNPSDIQVFFPMKDGVIARIDDMQYLLCLILGSGRHAIRGVQYVAAVPTDITEVEKKAFYDLLLHSEAKARSVRIVERGIADALGCGVDVMSEKGFSSPILAGIRQNYPSFPGECDHEPPGEKRAGMTATGKSFLSYGIIWNS